MSSRISYRSSLRKRRVFSKYYTLAQLDQQQKHWTAFVDFVSNPTGESGEVI